MTSLIYLCIYFLHLSFCPFVVTAYESGKDKKVQFMYYVAKMKYKKNRNAHKCAEINYSVKTLSLIHL